MKTSEHRYLWNGDDIRVIVAGDVVSIPGTAGRPGWSMGGFGASIDQPWLLSEGGLPGPKPRRLALCEMIVRSLEIHHKGGDATGDGRVRPKGPYAKCPTCTGSGISGFVPVKEGDGLKAVLQAG